MLPIKSLLNFRALLHIHLHGEAKKIFRCEVKIQPRKVSKVAGWGCFKSGRRSQLVSGSNRTEWVEYSDTIT